MVASKLVILCAAFVIFSIQSAFASLQVEVSNDGSRYNISVDNKVWLPSGDIWFNSQNKRFSVADGTLKPKGHHGKKGVDIFGEYDVQCFKFGSAPQPQLNIETSIKTYPALRNVAVFSQRYTSGASGTKARTTDDVVGSFPSFLFPDDVSGAPTLDLGYIAYGNDMAGWVSLATGRWMAERANFSTGIQGGPIILFDGSTNAVVISPLSRFTAVSNMRKNRGRKGDQISWGIMGGVDKVPVNFQADVVVYYSDKGINHAVQGWGTYITNLYAKTSDKRDADLTLTHLGYWTDNGAYYYYNKVKGENYEDTMIDVVRYLNKIQLPVRYLQIDSWFYKKGHVNGTRSWTPMESIFPKGFDYLYSKTGLPIACHNRYWDNDTVYAQYNGGSYEFLSDKKTGLAVAYDQHFWMDLFKNVTQRWGKFIMYEQDWFNKETDKNMALLTDIDLAYLWLKRMGVAADAFDVTLQYCMEYCRHILQSVEISAVTQARASDDYQPGNEQFRIGVTSMLLDALKIAPSKDTFWTTSVQPGNTYKKSEKSPFIQTVMATLSTGPVGPGDGIGFVNKDLLMRCCDSDGKILKPTRAATAMDASIKRLAFDDAYKQPWRKEAPKPDDEFVYTTYAKIESYYFLTVVAGFVKKPYELTLGMGWPELPLKKVDYVIYNAISGRPESFQEISATKAMSLGPNCESSYCFFQASPILWPKETGGGIVLLGESEKFVPMSPQRFSTIQYTNPRNIRVGLNVNAKETVTVHYLRKNRPDLQSVTCDNTKGNRKMAQSYIKITLEEKEIYANCTLQA